MKDEKTITVKRYNTPIGQLLLGSIGHVLCLCDWRTETYHPRIDKRLQQMLSASYQEGSSSIIETAQIQLDEYFAGSRQCFDIPLLPFGTDFQMQVWKELIQIPYGVTLSYAELARRLGRPTAYRAVANANHANHLSVFIPCHRVIGSNHTLTGYGGGLLVKQKLLELEGCVIRQQDQTRQAIMRAKN